MAAQIKLEDLSLTDLKAVKDELDRQQNIYNNKANSWSGTPQSEIEEMQDGDVTNATLKIKVDKLYYDRMKSLGVVIY